MRPGAFFIAAMVFLARAVAAAEPPLAADPPRPHGVLILDTESVGSLGNAVGQLEDLIGAFVTRHPGYESVPDADMHRALYAAERKVAGCRHDSACVVALGRDLGAQFVVSSLVRKDQGGYVLEMSLLPTGQGEVSSQTFETMRRLKSLEMNVGLCLNRLFHWSAQPASSEKQAKGPTPPGLTISLPSPAAAPALGPAPKPPHVVAVLDTVPQNVDGSAAALATRAIAEYVANVLHLDTVTLADLRKAVSAERLNQLTGACHSESCSQSSDLGRMFGAEKLLTSTLGRIGDRFQLTVVIMDAATSRAVARGTRELRTEAEILENARDLAHFVLRNEQRDSRGYARITVNAQLAQITVDGSESGVSPLATPLRLPAGKHTLSVTKEGFLPFEGALTVQPGVETTLDVLLLSRKNVTVAGAGVLPWAGATAGVAVVGGALSIASYYKALGICREWSLDSRACHVPGQPLKTATTADLQTAESQVTLYGKQLATYGGIASGVVGGVSVALFSAYFIVGLRSGGGGGDQPSPDVVAPSLEPSPGGFVLRF